MFLFTTYTSNARAFFSRCLSIALLSTMSLCSLSLSAAPDNATQSISQSLTDSPIMLAQAVEGSVNINTASAEEISAHLKGVGLKKAQAIVAWREANGVFTTKEQLMEVKGIGEKTLLANADKIAL